MTEHVCGDDLWIGRFGPPDSNPHAHEVATAQLALERLQAVVTGKATTEARAYLAEGQVDLVMHDHNMVKWHFERSPCRTDGASDLVHKGLRPEHRHPRAWGSAGSGGIAVPGCHCATFGDAATKTLFGAPDGPALGKPVGDHEADVMASLCVLATGIAQPDDQPVRWRAASKGAQELLLGGGAALVGGRLAGTGLSHELGLGFDLGFLLGLQARRRDRCHRGSRIVEQGDTLG